MLFQGQILFGSRSLGIKELLEFVDFSRDGSIRVGNLFTIRMLTGETVEALREQNFTLDVVQANGESQRG